MERAPREDSPAISVVVPVYNEEESLPHLCAELARTMKDIGRSYEIVFVDDGSSDGSFAFLQAAAAADSRLRVVQLRRNFGQTAAMAAGFDHADGQVVLPLDADLQNDPADIPLLLAKLEEGYDVVAGWRRERKDKKLTVTLPSRLGNALIGRVTGVRLHDYGCTLKAFRREILQDIRLYGEMHRFIPAFAHLAGARIAELPVTHHPRRWGRSKYSLAKTFRVLLDLLTVHFLGTYATKPLYFFGRFALLAFVLGFLAMVWTAIHKLALGVFVKDQPMFLIGIFFGIAGLQFLLFGVLAELSMRTYFESQRKPTYFVRTRVNVADPRAPGQRTEQGQP